LPSPEETGFTDTRFTVPGMRCAGCIAKIERGLAEVEGIEAARVNFSAKRVAVRHSRSLDEPALLGACASWASRRRLPRTIRWRRTTARPRCCSALSPWPGSA
jgi:copper chaperone CopZ